MQKEDGSSDHDNQEKDQDDSQEPDWIEKHLAKIVVLVGVLCVLGLTGRALTG